MCYNRYWLRDDLSLKGRIEIPSRRDEKCLAFLSPNEVDFRNCTFWIAFFSGTDNSPLMGTGCVNDGKDVITVCGQCAVLFDVCYPIGVDYALPTKNLP